MRRACFALVLLAGCVPSTEKGGPAPGAVEQKTFRPYASIEDLSKALAGKTQQQVIDLVGKPTGGEGDQWRYSNSRLPSRPDRLVADPVTGLGPADVLVTFDAGRVVAVEGR